MKNNERWLTQAEIDAIDEWDRPKLASPRKVEDFGFYRFLVAYLLLGAGVTLFVAWLFGWVL